MGRSISRWSLLALVSTAVFLSVIDIFVVNVAIPSIKVGIRGTDTDMQWVIVLYVLGYASFLIAGGRAGDYFGKKPVFVIGMAAFTLSSFLCGLSQNTIQLNIGRTFQGISAAFMVPQGISYIQVLFQDQKSRTKALGIYGSIAGAASVIGQFLGGVLPEIHSFVEGWRLLFLINVPIGIIAIGLSIKYLENTVIVRTQKFDSLGAALLVLTLACFIYPIVQGRELGWPIWIFILFGLSILIALFFFWQQRRRQNKGKLSLIDVSVFKHRDFTIGLFASVFYFMVQDSYFLINVVLLQNGFGINSFDTGLYFVFQGVGYVIASLLSIRLITLYGKFVLIFGVMLMVVSLIFHLWLLDGSAATRPFLPLVFFVYGIGCGTVLPSLLTVSLRNLPSSFAGMASGTYSTFQQTAIALGVGIVGGIFFYILKNPHRKLETYLEAYKAATITNIILLLIVAVFLLFISHKKAK
ncbi:EmrB/QacA subfamily drug resistance transporter [Flavobacterium endophyticum]|uniref:EmrB/QacA subfamily drug resistance transporter n=1 Tax=Flavobacterium endophyticum TaxID=1540163 RepID=A0A495LXS8_9FLAO|nr:MFS transporter [Flavobacterium endophyticum]RKS17885.1 EmrB/QacA subfamily drug resistance transporter [Flavobacterium endophyticum]